MILDTADDQGVESRRLHSHLKSAGAELLDSTQKTPVGRKMRYRHKDGLIVEYVQHDR